MRSRIMYIEDKSRGLTGPARIGRVTFSNGATLTYGGRSFQSLKGSGFKANYFATDNGDPFWISGPRRDGADGLYGRITQPQDVDEDVALAYWRDIRGLAEPPSVHASLTASSSARTDDGGGSAGPAHGRSHARVAKRLRDARRDLTRSMTAASEPAFARVWENPEDEVYDAV